MKNILIIMVNVFLFWSCSNIKNKEIGKENVLNDTTQVLNTINNVFGWAVNKDFELFFNSLANDSNFISVTPYNRVKHGFVEVLKDTSFWANPSFKAVSHELGDVHLQFSEDDTVVWFYCVLNDYNTWDGKPINWENVRWTGIVEKRDGEWKVVQQHFSFAAS